MQVLWGILGRNGCCTFFPPLWCLVLARVHLIHDKLYFLHWRSSSGCGERGDPGVPRSACAPVLYVWAV